ncbi:MAG: sugar transferase [Armatimonadia bacterium]|nr:sugar transferase [Armatimonadia bacterium]
MAEQRTVEQVELRSSGQWLVDTSIPAPATRLRADGGASSVYLALKRASDIVLALIGIILCLPIWIAVAVVIKLDSPGPVLFRQRRPGQFGVPFLILKFRTMFTDAEERLDEVLSRNREEDDSLIRVEDDPRITRVGYWLRKWSIDETPQFFNVLKGEMSIVGPRPISRPIPDPRGYMRLDARPGITGVWQTNGRKLTDCKHMLDLDMQYLEDRCLRLDLAIVFRTFSAVLRAEGAE